MSERYDSATTRDGDASRGGGGVGGGALLRVDASACRPREARFAWDPEDSEQETVRIDRAVLARELAAAAARVPGHVPSSMAQRSIAKAKASVRKFDAAPLLMALACLALAIVVSIVCAGCASPAADYVRAEKAAWDQFDADGRLDRWVDQEPTFSEGKKDAMHQLNVARRIRVAHAVAAVGS